MDIKKITKRLSRKSAIFRPIMRFSKLALQSRLKSDLAQISSGNPIFYHRSGGPIESGMTLEADKDFWSLEKYLAKSKECPHDDQLVGGQYLTYNNQSGETLVERCYKRYGLNCSVLARDYHPWDWMGKVRPVLNFLDSGECRDDFIVLTDADDILIVNDPRGARLSFEKYGCDVLFCNTVGDWPPDANNRAFEWSINSNRRFHCHLSAGGYVGRRKAIMEMLTQIINRYDNGDERIIYNGGFDDQHAWRVMHSENHPRIQIDIYGNIFKRFDIFRFS